jgi:hypothetical protein
MFNSWSVIPTTVRSKNYVCVTEEHIIVGTLTIQYRSFIKQASSPIDRYYFHISGINILS